MVAGWKNRLRRGCDGFRVPIYTIVEHRRRRRSSSFPRARNRIMHRMVMAGLFSLLFSSSSPSLVFLSTASFLSTVARNIKVETCCCRALYALCVAAREVDDLTGIPCELFSQLCAVFSFSLVRSLSLSLSFLVSIWFL